MGMLLLYRKFIEDPNSEDVNATSLAATDKNLKLIAFAFVVALVGMATVKDPPAAKAKQ
jgi:hypothetical protein